MSSGSRLTNGLPLPEDFEVVELRHKNHPILQHPPTKIEITLPQKGRSFGITIKRRE